MLETEKKLKRVAVGDRREQIVRVALELLGSCTVDALTTRDLARALGLTQPALFRHFKNREHLLIGVVEYARTQLEEVAAEILKQEADALEQLRALGDAFLDQAERQLGVPRLLFASPTVSGGIREALRGFVSMQRSVVAELVRQGQVAGSIDGAIEPRVAATVFVGMLQGLILKWEMGGHDLALHERFSEHLQVWLQGVKRRRESPTRGLSLAEPGPGMRLLDLRAIMAIGADPLAEVVEALERAPYGGVLVVEAAFRPGPLLALLQRWGHPVHVEALDAQRWVVEVAVRGEAKPEDMRDVDGDAVERRVAAAVGGSDGGVYVARMREVPRGLVTRLRRRGCEVDSVTRSDGITVLRVTTDAEVIDR